MRSIKDMVKDKQTVTFTFYKDYKLWYATECGFEFPVPISEIGTAICQKTDRAMLFMRWIKRHRDFLEQAEEESMLN
jgi:hypothetical protein